MTYLSPIDIYRLPGSIMDRASQLDRSADAALSVGRVNQAERLAHKAAELRAGAHAPEQLPIHDEHRLRAGVEHVAQLGPRAIACLLLQVVAERRDTAGTLDLLDQWRAALSPAAVRLVGGHRWPAGHPVEVLA